MYMMSNIYRGGIRDYITAPVPNLTWGLKSAPNPPALNFSIPKPVPL